MKKFLFPTLLLLFSLSSCVKDDFDAPPADGEDPDITSNISIRDLKNRFHGTPVEITDSAVIKGVVISDDKAGNFYKTLVIEDSTGGISIRIDQTNLYVDYPIGRRVFVECKGLWLGDYSNLVQLGGALDNSDPQNPGVLAIPSALVGNYILKGKYNVPIAPIILGIDGLNNDYQNMLIRLENVEFASADLGSTYADAVGQFSENRTVKDCNGNTVILRSSGFARFAGDTLPEGNGTMTAILSVFGTDFQLLINDVTDVQFDSTRCNGGTGGGDGIAGIRSLYEGTDVTLGANKTITGIVISNSDNFDVKNMVIQDSTGGIVVRFTAAHSFNLGDEVEVDASGATLTEFHGLMEIDGVAISDVQTTGTGSITPRVATIDAILSNVDEWESTLVQIVGATITGSGSTYSGTNVLHDASTGNINLFTRTTASFASTSYPTGAVNVTGVLGEYDTPQINLRSLADVQ